MALHRTTAVTGLRTAPVTGLRHDIGTALSVTAGQPELWLIGALSFSLRGGIVLLTLPILVLPTQVEVRLALGSHLGSTGLTAGFWALIGAATIVLTLIAVAVLSLLARLELAAFERLWVDPEVEAMGLPTDVAPPSRIGHGAALLTRLFAVQALTLVALLISAVPLAASIGQATLDEILRPSSGASIYLRVLGDVLPTLVLVAALLPLLDALSALTSRELLVARLVPSDRARGPSLVSAFTGALGGVVRAPLRMLGTVAVAWLVTLSAVLGVGWGLGVAWQATRASFLATTSVADLFSDVAPFLVALMLSAVFCGGLATCGFVSAFRSALWTISRLHR